MNHPEDHAPASLAQIDQARVPPNGPAMPPIEPAEAIRVLDFAASRCDIALMQTSEVMAAVEALAQLRPDLRATLVAFWHALQLRRPSARRHDAYATLATIKRRIG